MKKNREHKVQILAALALAFTLGMIVPSAVFASEDGADDGVAVQAADAAVTNASSAQLAALVTSIKGEADYEKYSDLYTAQTDLAKALTDTPEATLKAAQDAVLEINDKAQIGDMNAEQLNNHILGMTGYSDWSAMFVTMGQLEKEVGETLDQATIADKLTTQKITNYYNALNKFVNRVQGTLAENAAKLFMRISTRDSFEGFRNSASLVEATEKVVALDDESTEAEVDAAVAALRAALAGVEGVADMKAEELVAKARETKHYTEYKNLYDAMDFVRVSLKKATAPRDGSGDEVVDLETQVAAALTADYANKQQELADNYAKMAAAAVKIDDTVMVGLMAYELPKTSAPDAPNTGIIGLIESGALDLGAITLIVSLAAAGVIGLGVIVRLYTRKAMLKR